MILESNHFAFRGEITPEKKIIFDRFLSCDNTSYLLTINLIGGNAFTTANIVKSAMQNSVKKCSCSLVETYAKSAGLYISQLGEIRLALPKSKFLIHRHHYQNQILENVNDDEREMYEFLSYKTKLSYNKILCLAENDHGKGTFFDAVYAKENNFIDYIIKK